MNKHAHRKLTLAELHAEARERFGDDPTTWAFECPNCGDVATAADFIRAGVGAGDPIGQECIGRTRAAARRRGEPGRGCNYAAYGLIAGPWEVAAPDRTIFSFPLASAPARQEASRQ